MRCPAGHESASTDYCDTCGVAMDAAGAAPAPDDTGQSAPVGGAPATPSATACPSCGAAAPPDALFCESCGYDFTTGTMPRPVEPLAPPNPLDVPGGAVGDAPATPAAPAAPAADPAPGNPSPPPAQQWVAEVWIDPDWYADQESTDPLPSPGLPTVVPLRHTSLLIGRASHSRGITPDIDLSSDNGISRRHAQLTTDGTRWFVEDLGSSNGTYLGDPAAALPTTPLPVGRKSEVGDDRIYLGAWTRIVLREATPGEV